MRRHFNFWAKIGIFFPLAAFAVSLLVGTTSADEAAETGFKSLFDGKTLDGWDGNPKFWSVKEGAITGQTTQENPAAGNTFLMWKDGRPGDFELRFSYKIVGGNSGVQYRSKDVGNWVVGGYQADIETGDTYSGILYEERGRGILAKRGQKVVVREDGAKEIARSFGSARELQKSIRKEDWNDYRIVARGNRLVHEINGKTMIDVTDEQKDKRADKGILALQLHAGPPMKVQFKNIRLKNLDESSNGTVAAPTDKKQAGPKEKKKVVFVAGSPSHGKGEHEYNAGFTLLANKLREYAPDWDIRVQRNGWPTDEKIFEGADTLVFFCDGGERHFAIANKKLVQEMMDRGVGLVCIHYAVEVPKEQAGKEFLDWIGGYFEPYWSVNPHWKANFEKLPDHPITRGVKPFEIQDEWYYHMRFRPEMKGVTPILTAIPPESTLNRPDSSHGGNPAVRAEKGKPQHVAWAAERDGGGRGFGFTGAHFHKNWGDDNFRKIVLNAIVWTAKGEVPKEGVPSKVTEDEVKAGWDPK